MILIEKTQIMGLEPTIRGMRNPMNSWAKSDSNIGCEHNLCENCDINRELCEEMLRLARAGSVDGKFRRMIAVYVDITAPLYWWKEFDTYKVGTVANSCSTMHRIHAKEFEPEDFSHDHLMGDGEWFDVGDIHGLMEPLKLPSFTSRELLQIIIGALNCYRKRYLETKDKLYWWQMIQLLPSSYNQKRTVMLNYEVLSNIYQHRRNHKLDEWRELCKWIESLPYSEVITCNVTEVKKAELKTFVGNSDTTPVHGGAFDRPTKAEQEEIETLQAAINKLRAQKWSEEQIQMVLKAWGDVQKEIQEMRS